MILIILKMICLPNWKYIPLQIIYKFIKSIGKIEFKEYDVDNVSKILFDLKIDNNPLIVSQNSSIHKNETTYNLESNPQLFIFLIDQSGPIKGEKISLAQKALKLFLQPLPPKSYQIIGFGTRYLKYDLIPKEYKKKYFWSYKGIRKIKC